MQKVAHFFFLCNAISGIGGAVLQYIQQSAQEKTRNIKRKGENRK